MTSVHRTMVVPAGLVVEAKSLADQFGPRAQNMWITPLSASGFLPATHYISSGLIDDEFGLMLSSPQNLVDGAAAMGVIVSIDEAIALLSVSDISADPPFVALERLGLQIAQEDIA